MVALAITVLLAACAKPEAAKSNGTPPKSSGNERSAASTDQPLPKGAYYLDSSLEAWIDPNTKYGTTRKWTLDGKKYQVLIMSPAH